MNNAPRGIWNSDGVCTQPDYNDASRGTPGPTTCANNKARAVGQYDPAKTHQPPAAGTPTTGGGGGGGGCCYYY